MLTKETIGNAVLFLERATVQGKEAPAYMKVVQDLYAELKAMQQDEADSKDSEESAE